eukprot:5022070-Pyramimonas_sp.AAC.1
MNLPRRTLATERGGNTRELNRRSGLSLAGSAKYPRERPDHPQLFVTRCGCRFWWGPLWGHETLP